VYRSSNQHTDAKRTNHTPIIVALGATLVLLPTEHRAQNCDFDYTITTGCTKEVEGYAVITGLDPGGYYEILWNGNKALGGTSITGLNSGQYWMSISDGVTCEDIVVLTIDCDQGGGTEPHNCQFRTQTQGGWGSPPNGNNPGAYLAAHFASAFPNGLEIGCTNRLRLTSAAAVRAFLPSGSNARPLPSGTLVDPGNS
jgi:hypothetical protein